MKLDTTAKLVSVEGDQAEYADMIGQTGRLYLAPGNNWFGPKGWGESLTMSRKRASKKGDRVRVSTHLGNVFVFQVGVPQPKPYCQCGGHNHEHS
jgi:hypothetical protein